MRYIPADPNVVLDIPVLELTRRNLEVLLAKLDMPESARTLIDSESAIAVRAVENSAHYGKRPAGPMLVNGEIV